jgi:acetyltransferase EpsM
LRYIVMSTKPKKRKLIIIGGGYLSCVVVEAAHAEGSWDIRGFVDPQPCKETTTRLGIPRLGDDSVLSFLTDEHLVLGIGSVKVDPARERVVAKLGAPDRWATIIHPFTSVSPTARVAAGVLILPGAVVCSGAIISEHAIINLGAKIDHDAYVGKFVHVAPQAALGGGSRVEDSAYVGMAAAIRDHVTVSAGTLVGMGAVVTNQFRAGSTLVGVPAKPIENR